MTKTIKKKSAALVAAAFEKLPRKMTCPKCKRSQPKTAYGVRVIKRDARGVPLVCRRQSWCAGCRSKS